MARKVSKPTNSHKFIKNLYKKDSVEKKFLVTKVYAQLKVEGIHRWAGCPIEEVAYLRNDHRHTFHIKATSLVSHSDRDVEFIQLAHKIKFYLESHFFDIDFKCLYFGNMSCEMIAQSILAEFKLIEVEVNEDGEGGAIVTDLTAYEG